MTVADLAIDLNVPSIYDVLDLLPPESRASDNIDPELADKIYYQIRFPEGRHAKIAF